MLPGAVRANLCNHRSFRGAVSERDDEPDRTQEASRAAARAREKSRELRVAFEGEATIRRSPGRHDVEARVDVVPVHEPVTADPNVLDGRLREFLVIAVGVLALSQVLVFVWGVAVFDHVLFEEGRWDLSDVVGSSMLAGTAFAAACVAGLLAVRRRAEASVFALAGGLLVWFDGRALSPGPEDYEMAVYVTVILATLPVVVGAVVALQWVVRLLRAPSDGADARPFTANDRLSWHARFLGWVVMLFLLLTTSAVGYWHGPAGDVAPASPWLTLPLVLVALGAFWSLYAAGVGPAQRSARLRFAGTALAAAVALLLMPLGGALALVGVLLLVPAGILLLLVAALRRLDRPRPAVDPTA